MTFSFDPQGDLREVARCVTEFRSCMDRLGSKLNTKAEISGWSPAQHLYHVALATDLGLGNVLALVRRKGILIREEGELLPETLAILSSQDIPRGAAQAPRMVQPAEWVEREQIETEIENIERSLQAIKQESGAIEDCPGWIKHQMLGPLNASHWARFCCLHGKHHLNITEEIQAIVN